MTQLGVENEGFKVFSRFREKIVNAQSLAEIADIREELQPFLNSNPEDGGMKLDLRKILSNAFEIRKAELHGDSVPQTDINTQNIPKDMLPQKDKETSEPQKKESYPQNKATGAEEVKLPAPSKLEGRAKEIAEEMKDVDAENFKTPSSPTGEALNPSAPVSMEKKTRNRTKPIEESTIEYVPRTEKSVKIFRRINVAINGISFTNNEIGYEVVAGTREEALEESKALRESALADIRELNELMKVKPTTQTTPAPKQEPKVEQVANPNIEKEVSEVFGDFDLEKVMKAVGARNPAGLTQGHEFDLYNLERLRALFATLRGVDNVEVKMADNSSMLLGTYITEETKKFGLQFPVAKVNVATK